MPPAFSIHNDLKLFYKEEHNETNVCTIHYSSFAYRMC